MKQQYTTRNAYLAIRARVSFKAGALRGTELPGGAYTVHSYDMQIASWWPAAGWIVNNEKVSVTTSRHQSQVARAIGAY